MPRPAIAAPQVATLGVEAMPLSPAQFDGYVRAEIPRYAGFVRAAGLKPN